MASRAKTIATISIHALLAESDVVHALKLANAMLFLSTLSLRRATNAHLYYHSRGLFLSTLSLRRATVRVYELVWGVSISIHALLAESDCLESFYATPRLYFYPRSPCGERPDIRPENLSSMSISIHALLAESDTSSTVIVILCKNFYPRSPCGERL